MKLLAPPPCKNNLKKSLGYYGIRKIYKFIGFNIAFKIRTERFEEILLCFCPKIRVYKKKVSKKFEEARILNCLNDSANLFEISKIPKGRSCILFLMDYLLPAGGVERRLELQFKWLEKHNIQPIIVARSQEYLPLDKYPFLRLIDYASNSQQKLLDLIRWTNAEVVEFNMKTTSFFHDVDIDALRRYARVGCMIHGKVELDAKQLNRLDYRCTSSIHANNYEGVSYIPNVVEFSSKTPKYNINSRKALYVGRIDSEKLPTIENFIRFCLKYNFRYEIAGPVNKKSRKVMEFCARIPASVFIGPIDTRRYLQEKGGCYAFIAGVGQVTLEAIAANLPAFVPSHEENSERAVFADFDNIEKLVEWNCVITKLPESLVKCNYEEFAEAKSNAEKLKSFRPLEPYCVRDALMRLRDSEKVYSEYVKVIFDR